MPARRPAESGFPGGTGVSRINVYNWEAADGVCGGSPHLHTATSEGYVVVGGRGRVQTLSAAGFEEYPLAPGTVLWFSPGTVHRLINDDGALDIVVVMGNAGLPESGDAVLTFPEKYLEDAGEYRQAAALPADGSEAEREAAARTRRDLALEGFFDLRAQIEQDGPEALDRLHRQAARLIRGKVGQWRALVEAGPLAQATATLERLEELAAAEAGQLAAAAVTVAEAASPEPGFGMCGRLQTWRLAPEP